jgi:hypothetical protein
MCQIRSNKSSQSKIIFLWLPRKSRKSLNKRTSSMSTRVDRKITTVLIVLENSRKPKLLVVISVRPILVSAMSLPQRKRKESKESQKERN